MCAREHISCRLDLAWQECYTYAVQSVRYLVNAWRVSLNIRSELSGRTPVSLWQSTFCENSLDHVTAQNLLHPPRDQVILCLYIQRRRHACDVEGLSVSSSEYESIQLASHCRFCLMWQRFGDNNTACDPHSRIEK